uniref:NADH-ubiquinone oxidoreductase chain 2 n=1 Tax=Bathytoma punicea TaxID=542572 RepID=A0A344H1D3_9COND|nr:NADH dehydrogenase subunit 2 [Bathytoma punicea]AXA45198.1 NADH dehydrogenase subunit 2 [Bathytoma punicea]
MFSSLPFGYMFLCVMGVGTFLSVSSIHWLSIWAGLEINLIGFLPMLVYQKGVSESESAVKYFIVQALGSSFLIFGSLMTFGFSFTWDLYGGFQFEILGFCILISGLSMKLGMFPFHYWLPSVMAGLPWFSCLLLATWQKLAPLFLLLCLFELNQSYSMIVMFCIISAGCTLVGGFGGMNQTQVRALLGYSSISHLGWITFAVLHGEWALKVYLSIYILTSLSLFMSLWMSDSGNMKNINSLKTSGPHQLIIMLLLLSLAGLPPLLGFIPKWLVIMVSSKSSWFPVVLLLIMGSLMSLFYYLSLFFSLFLSLAKKYGLGELNISNKSIITSIAVLNIIGGLGLLLSNALNML